MSLRHESTDEDAAVAGSRGGAEPPPSHARTGPDRSPPVGGPVRGDGVCPGCGVELPDPGTGAPPHEGASPGCWAVYGDVLGREYGEWGDPPIHRLTHDTYAAQHPGTPSRQRIQSLGGHLVALYLAVERGVEPQRIAREIGRAVADPSAFVWLEPPPAGSSLTIVDVHGAASLREHTTRVERWARSVWEAWSDHHDVVRRWAGR